MTEKLKHNNTPSSSVCFAALNNTLVYDRLQGGPILDEKDFFAAVAYDRENKQFDRRTSSVGSQGSKNMEYQNEIFHDLPSTILERLLLFLPDKSVAAASRVCKTWYNEIGQHSPNLWLELLKRRNWPVPAKIERDVYRQTFVEHYMVVRDIQALSKAVESIENRQPMQEIEACYQDFSIRKHSPSNIDKCVSINVWSDKLILAGYANECSLRLYEATRLAMNDTGELRCKELVCQNISPYRNTKKRNCRLIAVEIDDHNIGCLCTVFSERVTFREADILVVLSRDEFLMGFSSEAGAKGGSVEADQLRVVDIGEAFLNFVLSSEVVDHRLIPLFDYLDDGGEIGDIRVKASESLSACGYGRFVVEVCVSIPNIHDNDEMTFLDRKLVLFSCDFNAVLWVGDSYPTHLQERHDDAQMVATAVFRQGTACTLATKMYHSLEILVTDIDAKGNVQQSVCLEPSSFLRSTIAEQNFSFVDSRSLIINLNQVITVEVVSCGYL